jgi:hypothetical protein
MMTVEIDDDTTGSARRSSIKCTASGEGISTQADATNVSAPPSMSRFVPPGLPCRANVARIVPHRFTATERAGCAGVAAPCAGKSGESSRPGIKLVATQRLIEVIAARRRCVFA